MIIKIHGLEWAVNFVPYEHERLEMDGVQCMGVTYFSDLEIYINQELDKTVMRQTVIHELVHAFMFSYGIHVEHNNKEIADECVCDFCGAHLGKIYKFTRKILKARELE